MTPGLGARRRNAVFGLVVLVAGTLCGMFAVFGSAAQASDNLSCPQGATEYKVDGNPLNGLSNGESAQFTVNGQTFTFTKVVGPSPFGDDTFDFTSTIAVSVVYVKGGVDTNEYDYAPPATAGSALHPPLNSGGQAPAISHVTFCAGGGSTTTTTVPETTTTVGETTTTAGETTTTVGETTTTVPETTTTVGETTTTVGETTTTVPETTTTVGETTTTVGETTTTVPETTTTVGDTTTTVPETTTTLSDQGTTTTVPDETTTTLTDQGSNVTTTSQQVAPTTVVDLGGPVATPSTAAPVTVPGTLPRTGSGSALAAMLGMSLVAAGVLLLARGRRAWSRP